MKKKVTWIIGIVIFCVVLGLLWNTITGGHGTLLQVLGIIGIVIVGSFILGMCMILTVPADPNYQPPEKSPKKEKGGSEIDAGKVVGTTAKVAFFPAYMIYAYGSWRRKRKKRKSDEFWRGFRPWY